MNLVAIETATDACSIALWCGGSVYGSEQLAAREHSRHLQPMLRDLLHQHGLVLTSIDGVAYGRGPGAFTGVRIAAAFATGLARGLDRPLIGISSLAALARAGVRASSHQHVLAFLDARMNQVYCGGYDFAPGLPVTQVAEHLCAPRACNIDGGLEGWVVAGPGWRAYGEEIAAQHGAAPLASFPDLLPAASDVVELAAATIEANGWPTAPDPGPVYLRDQVVQTPPRR